MVMSERSNKLAKLCLDSTGREIDINPLALTRLEIVMKSVLVSFSTQRSQSLHCQTHSFVVDLIWAVLVGLL